MVLSTILPLFIGLMLTASVGAHAQGTPIHGAITTDSPGTSSHLKAFRRASTPGKVYAELHRYEGRYVLYAPCNGGAEPTLTISNHAVHEYLADGPAKTSVKKLPGRAGCMMYVTDLPGDTLKFYTLEGASGMTILERTSETNAARYMLLASAKSLRKYPVVKLHCITGRLREVEFDPIDFALLISQRRR